MPVLKGERIKLRAKRQLACPSFLGYPINNRKHAKAAHSRYHQRGTRKCSGGHSKICRALKKYNITGYDCPK